VVHALGDRRTPAALTGTTREYTGQQRDDTGLLFYNARYYDPVLGRFVSPDTIVPGTSAGSGGAAA
jgi:RHS repeat-associated protein